VAGATLRLLSAATSAPLPAGCFDDPAQQGQVTLADGWYKFDVNFSDPACPVPACPGSANDVIPATNQFCEVEPSELPPAPAIPPLDPRTTYHLHLMLNGLQTPGSSQIFNNHIPIDPLL